MIHDEITNTLYLADSTMFEFNKESNKLKQIIIDHKYSFKILKETEDYYCRDYMPVQINDNEFVQFIFRPKNYLKKKELKYITNPVKVELVNELKQPKYSRLVLDGGNLVKWKDKVFITDRVLKDNLFQFESSNAIIAQLENDLKCKVILIPEYPEDNTGHADGLIRFINDETVIVNDTSNEPEKEWLREFKKILNENNLFHISIPCRVTKNRNNAATGLYINYLHLGNLIVVPQFGYKEDEVAKSILKEIFGSTHSIVPMEANWIAQYGGVFNCCSWTVKE